MTWDSTSNCSLNDSDSEQDTNKKKNRLFEVSDRD